MVYGYARVSTDGQGVDAQVRQLLAAGAGKVFLGVASGAAADRPQLRRAVAHLKAGDVLTVLGGLAELERELIRARTTEGRERARARGVHLGCKPKLTLHQKREAIRRGDVLGETLADIARSYNVSRSTISRLTA